MLDRYLKFELLVRLRSMDEKDADVLRVPELRERSLYVLARFRWNLAVSLHKAGLYIISLLHIFP